MRDIDRLRAEVRARQQAANRKLRRIERQGINIRGSEFDPTTHGKDISRMRSRDLERLRNQLNGFVSRGTQFVGIDGGRKPLPRAKWRAFDKLQKRVNQNADKLQKSISDIKMPGGQSTLGERHAYATDTKFPKTANHTVNSPLRKHTVVPQSVASEKALRALTKRNQKKVDPQYLKLFVKRGRAESRAMSSKIGDMHIEKELDKLTDKQFHILWAYTEFPTLRSTKYENEQYDPKDKASMSMESGLDAESLQWIECAKTIDDKPNNPNAVKLYTSTKAKPTKIYNSTKAGPIDIP